MKYDLGREKYAKRRSRTLEEGESPVMTCSLFDILGRRWVVWSSHSFWGTQFPKRGDKPAEKSGQIM